MALLLTSLLWACERAAPPTEYADVDHALASTPAVIAVCDAVSAHLAGECCWAGQSRDASGACVGVPSSCPSPLLLYPPAQTCDACAGSPSCTEAIADCGPGGDRCLAIASRYVSKGQGLQEDMMRATSLFISACDASNLMACNNAGIHFERALGAPKDPVRALAFFEKACPRDAQVAPGCHNLARAYRALGEQAQADALLTHRCETVKIAESCSTLLNALITREAAPDDLARARLLALAEASCTPDNQRGCTQLATLLRSFYPDDAGRLERANTLLGEACAQQAPPACLELAKLHEQGAPQVQKDPARAFALYEQACKLKLWAACGPLAIFYLRVDVPTPEGELSIELRRKRARELGQIACAQAEMTGCNALALLEQGGDRAASAALVSTRAQVEAPCVSGDQPGACALLGELEIRGLGGKRELKTGLTHLESACQSGIVGACQRRAAFPDSPKRRLNDRRAQQPPPPTPPSP